MTRQEFEAEIGKAKGMENADIDHQHFWIGYARGLRRGYHGVNFGTFEEHVKFWVVVERMDKSRRERGMGYRAGIRCAKLGSAYCSQNSFRCETCSLANQDLDCHKNQILKG